MAALSTDPALFIFTSLTAGSSHIVTATSRLETILRANRIPFKAVDIATDQKARMLWGRRAGKDAEGRVRKLPGLVQEGFVIGDLVEVEEWNEYGELKQHVQIHYDEHTIPSINNKPPSPKLKPRAKPTGSIKAATAISAAAASPSTTAEVPEAPPLPYAKNATEPTTTTKTEESKPAEKKTELPIRSVADEAAQKAKEMRLKTLREKVHGKEGAAAKEAEAKAAAEAGDKENTDEGAKLESQDDATAHKEADAVTAEEAKKVGDEAKVEDKPEAEKQAEPAEVAEKDEKKKEATKQEDGDDSEEDEEDEHDDDEEDDDDDDDDDEESGDEHAKAKSKK